MRDLLSRGGTWPSAVGSLDMSPKPIDKDVSELADEDCEEDPIPNVGPGFMEEDIRRVQTFDSVNIINSLKMSTDGHSRLLIPLCRLVPMPMVRPTLSCDLTQFEN